MRAPLLLLFGFVFFLGRCFFIEAANDPCDPDPCMNNGTCTVSDGKAVCLCVRPYKGDFCNESPCEPNPCQNNGKCKIREDTQEKDCSCTSEFTGENCDTRKCSQHPCENNGTCFIEDGTAKCKCKEPFEGDTCELGPCNPDPCKNSGVCEVHGNSFKCICLEQFKGPFCSESRETSTEPIPKKTTTKTAAQQTNFSTPKEEISTSALKPTDKNTTKSDNSSESTKSSTSSSTISNSGWTSATKGITTSSIELSTSSEGSITADESTSTLTREFTSGTITPTEKVRETTTAFPKEDTSVITRNPHEESTSVFDDGSSTGSPTSLSTAAETTTGAVETTTGAVETTTGAVETTTGAVETTTFKSTSSTTSIAHRTSSEHSSSDYTSNIIVSSQDDITDMTYDKTLSSGTTSVTAVSNGVKEGTEDSVQGVNEGPTSKVTATYIGCSLVAIIALGSLLVAGWYIKSRFKRRSHAQYVEYASSEISVNSEEGVNNCV